MGYRGEYEIASAIRTACVWEATARKVGNVHRYRDFTTSTYLDFVLSAGIAADYLTDTFGSAVRMRRDSGRVGNSIRHTVRMTRDVVGTNTNLGIVILLAPLGSVWVEPDSGVRGGELNQVLANLNVEDARHVYEAIRVASPGGLGDAPEQDVREEPTVTLLEAMKLAADRDMVARQYANGFADVFDFGVPAFVDALARFGCVEAAIIDSQLRWLATYPDSLIARKNGTAIAEDVQRRAAEALRLGGIATSEGRAAGVALDKHLRSDGNKLNPGTTADLITACLFVALRENKVTPSAPFRWDVPDWL
ncbi:MAG: triphosphoribosyl-dephospho-CoA synthetase [Planctomycetes bacterium]|nr:triphosphoribosyl-dephospho-CoA synthetase [Planctomycetota bacterium]